MKKENALGDLFAPPTSQHISAQPPEMTPEYIEALRAYAQQCKMRLLGGRFALRSGALATMNMVTRAVENDPIARAILVPDKALAFTDAFDDGEDDAED